MLYLKRSYPANQASTVMALRQVKVSWIFFWFEAWTCGLTHALWTQEHHRSWDAVENSRGHASVNECCLKLYSVWLVFISLFKLYLKVLMVNVLQVVKNHTKLQILMYSVSPLLSMNHAYVYLGACKVQYVPQFICPYLLGTSSKRTFYLPPTGTATRDGTVAKLNRHRFYEFCIAEKLNRSGTIRLFGCLFMLAVSIDDTPWERWNNI